MRGNAVSDAPSVSSGSTEDDGQNDVESENLTEDSNEEPYEEYSEEIVSQSYNENDCSEQSSEEPDEEGALGPSEQLDPQPSRDTGNKTEQPDDDQNDGESGNVTEDSNEEPFEEYSEEIVSQSYNENECSEQSSEDLDEEEVQGPSKELGTQLSKDTDNRIEHPAVALTEEEEVKLIECGLANSNEKKRSLDAKDGNHRLAKKCKPDQFVGSVEDVGSAITPEKGSDPEAHSNTANSSEKQEHPGSSGKRRRSRWDPQPKCDDQGGENERTSKRRKTRWAADDSQLKMLGPIQLPDFVKKLVEADLDPEIQELKENLLKINRKLQGEVRDDRPLWERSPSPPPVYDGFGIRTNSRDARFREKLIQDRQNIISRLIEKNPTFKPPADYKPPKLYKRLYIPSKEYPGYNFIGLIIGPRGLTQKRMEKETGAKILLRGVGSVKERKPQLKPDPSDNEDLHVWIEADNQKSLDDAVGMVEKLLIPVDEGMNEHKRAQLRELAELNGKLCKTCGVDGHMQYACPNKNSILNSDIYCDTCGGSSHSTANCPLTMSTPSSDLANQQPRTSVADVGGAGGYIFSTPQISSRAPWQSGNTGFGILPPFGSNSHSGPGLTPTTEGDDANLLVRYLPQSVDDDRIRDLFTPFGRVVEAKVIKDRTTGGSKGYGFVKYDNPINAATAVARMNGYKIDGKTLAVRVARQAPTALPSSTGLQPWHRGPATLSQESPGSWPGPPGSMLPDPPLSSTKSNNFGLPHSSVFLGHSDSSCERSTSSHHVTISSPSSLIHFPGNPDYPKSQHPSYHTPPSVFTPQLNPIPSLGGSVSPFPWNPIQSPPGQDPFRYT